MAHSQLWVHAPPPSTLFLGLFLEQRQKVEAFVHMFLLAGSTLARGYTCVWRSEANLGCCASGAVYRADQ